MDIIGKQLPTFINADEGKVPVIKNGMMVLEPASIAAAPAAVELTGTDPVIETPANNTVYTAGEITSLEITNAAEGAIYTVIFISGETPATLDIPEEIIFPEDFEIEANTRYELNIWNNYGLAAGWPWEAPTPEVSSE